MCPKCGDHGMMPARERLHDLFDRGRFTELFREMRSVDFLDFTVKGNTYKDKLSEYEMKSGENSAFIAAFGKISGIRCHIGVMNFRFLGGSMGSVIGEKFWRLCAHCVKKRTPLVIVCASGGARMQEGIISLMQMAKTSAALHMLETEKIPYISVLTHPTTGGVSASFAMLGDVIIAEKGALIGFAGPRVIEQTIKQKLPEGFQRADFVRDCGMVDIVCTRDRLKEKIGKVLGYLWKN